MKYIPNSMLNAEQVKAKERALAGQTKEYASYAVDNNTAAATESINELRDAQSTDGEALFSLRAVEEDLDEYRRMLKRSGIMNDRELDDLMTLVNTVMDKVRENDAILDFDDDIDNRVYNPVKPNSDQQYKISIDFSTLCRKRLLQMAVQERIETEMGTVMTSAERNAARNALRVLQERGRQIEVACGLCYVESARLKAPEQIGRFMSDRRFFMRDYFAKHNAEFKRHVAEAAADWKVDHGYDADASKKSMSGNDKKALTAMTQKMYTQYQMTAEEERMADIMDKLPASAMQTAKGLENLKREHPELANVFNTFLRERTKSKAVETDTSWRAYDYSVISDEIVQELNGLNGTRSQSWSDFQVIHLLDYMAMVMELASRNAMLQTYTKVPDFIRLMGNTGAMINCSLIPLNESTDLEFDPVEGMPKEIAMELREKYPDTVGTISIGIGYDHIRSLLKSNSIDFVIPYHASSLSVAKQHQMGLKNWKSFQNFQNEKIPSGSNAKAPTFSEWYSYDKALGYYNEALKGISDPTVEQKWKASNEAMSRCAADYVQMCHDRGITEKFADFANDEGYWKLLIDHKMINQKTGEIIEQKALRPVFNQQDILDIMSREIDGFDRKEHDFAEAVDVLKGMWERGEIQKTAKRSTADAQMKDFRKLMDLQGIEAVDHTGEESQYSVRTYDGDITVREFMRSMDTSELTVQEKKAYAAYTAQYDKVQDISSKLIEQQNLAAVSVSQDERVAAQNRADILQKQLMRESQTLYRMESSKGAAWMLRDARMLEEYLWSSESTDVNMMISDLNAKL